MVDCAQLIAVAMDFAAFLMSDTAIAPDVHRIVLFGSVATGDCDEESDIDLFIETARQGKKRNGQAKSSIRKRLDLWNLSTRAEMWKAQGIRNELSLRIGALDEWKDIHRAIASHGILLYGKFIEPPKGLRQYALVSLRFPKLPPSGRVALLRTLYGYKQKAKGKVYTFEGAVGSLGGVRLKRANVMMPIENAAKLYEFLRRKKISYLVREIWAD
ncbi:MAG: nucleotidyltransferase domain-containing protein [Nanoarchaeota archaeon]